MARVNHRNADLEALVLPATQASAIVETEIVQTLWSGYGQIVRCHLKNGSHPSVIVKHVQWPDQPSHRYGWNSDRSHARKVQSYQIESTWYDRYAPRCSELCRVPLSLTLEIRTDGIAMVLEDLDAAGFAGREQSFASSVSDAETSKSDVARALESLPAVDACLSWLANFHATFMGTQPEGLWGTGTYWHLATRPDELDALADGPLKEAASTIDRRLQASPFQTLVHGDAKLANFCFEAEGPSTGGIGARGSRPESSWAAAVDFQYVGGGCGMKDLAYFIGSCFDEDASERLAPTLLDRYFELLADALSRSGNDLDFAVLEHDWRALYPVAWTDFYRFLKGWSPGHWKLHAYSERLAREVLEAL